MVDQVPVYNNLASAGSCDGRLLIEMEVHPELRLKFDFERLSGEPCDWANAVEGGQAEFRGYGLHMHNSSINGHRFGSSFGVYGNASRVDFGDAGAPGHMVVFFLTNLKCLESALASPRLWETVTDRKSDMKIAERSGGLKIDVPIDEEWSLSLYTPKEAGAWLDSKANSSGTYLTTKGVLYQPSVRAGDEDSINAATEITMDEALVRIRAIEQFISFANGGATRAPYIELSRLTHSTLRPVEFPCRTFRSVVPARVENLGTSWVSGETDMEMYVSRLGQFERLLREERWSEMYAFVMAFYETAITNRTWPIASASIGMALERLAYSVLVEQEHDATARAQALALWANSQGLSNDERDLVRGFRRRLPKGGSRQARQIELLLKKLGLEVNQEEVDGFVSMRNDAVHPRQVGLDASTRGKVLRNGLLWVEETLLWQLGYRGRYGSRMTSNSFSIDARYRIDESQPTTSGGTDNAR